MNKQNQNGSIHVIIISLVTVILVAAIGFLFWNNFIQAKVNEKPTIIPSKNVTPTSAPTILSIADWGIKFTVPDGLKLADIVNYKAHVGEGPDYYGFTTDRVREQGGLCDNQVTGNLAELDRSTAKTNTGTLLNDKPINGYYYFLWSSVDDVKPAPECLQTNSAITDHQLLDKMLRTITEDPATSGALHIPEIGIKLINIPDTIKDLSYAIDVHGKIAGRTTVWLSTATLFSKDKDCSASSGSLGVLDKLAGNYDDNQRIGLVKQFDGFWIAHETPQATCSENEDAQNLQTSQLQIFGKFVSDPANIQLIK